MMKTPLEILNEITVEKYNWHKGSDDAFSELVIDDTGKDSIEVATLAMETYHKQQSEKYITALTAIANQTDVMIGWSDAGVRCRHLARKALNLE